jgi:putative phosphoribosyl transferase
MVIPQAAIFQDRRHAAHLLGERLNDYRDTDTIILAVPGGGIHVGYYLANQLNLILEVMPCRKIKHPADSKTIGAVCTDSVVLREEDNNIPQDYIYHQIQLLRHVIQGQNSRYYQGRNSPSFTDKTVIVVDDLIMTGDTMLACLKTIKKQSPAKIVVAVPAVTPEATRAIAAEMDEIVYLTIEPTAQTIKNLYAEFPNVCDEEVISLLELSRSSVNEAK